MIDYALWLSLWKVIGGVALMMFVNNIVKKSGRQSLIVVCLALALAPAVILFPLFGAFEVKSDLEQGRSIFSINTVC